MLVLNVQDGDYVMFGDDIKVRVYKQGALFKLAIDAPREMPILRQSLYERSNPAASDSFVAAKKRPAPAGKGR